MKKFILLQILFIFSFFPSPSQITIKLNQGKTAAPPPVTDSKVELILPIGHQEPIINIEFDKTNKQLLTSGFDKSIIWDLKSGKPIRQIPFKNTPNDCSTFCNGYEHIIGFINGVEKSVNCLSGQAETCPHGYSKKTISGGQSKEVSLADNTYTISSSTNKFQCRFSHSKLSFYDANDQLVSSFIIKDNNLIKSAGNAENDSEGSNTPPQKMNPMDLFSGKKSPEQFKNEYRNLAKNQLDPRLKRILSVEFSKNEKYAVIDFNKGFPELVDLNSMAMPRKFLNEQIKDSLFSTKSIFLMDDKWIVSFFNGTIVSVGNHCGYIYEVSSGKLLKVFKAGVESQPNLEFSNNENTILISGFSSDYTGGVTFSGGKSKLFYKPKENKFYSDHYQDDASIIVPLDSVIIDAKYSMTVNNRGLRDFWESFSNYRPGLKAEMLPDSGKGLVKLFFDDEKNLIDLLFSNGNYVVYNPKTNKILSVQNILMANNYPSQSARYFTESEDKNLIGFNVVQSHAVCVYDKTKKSIVFRYQFPAMANASEHLIFGTGKDEIWFWNANSVFTAKNLYDSNSIVPQGNDPSFYSNVSNLNKQINSDLSLMFVQTENTIRVFDTKTRTETGNFSCEGKIVYADLRTDKVISTGGGMVNFYSISQMKKLFSLILIGESDYMFITASLKYYGTKEAASQLAFRKDWAVYSFDQFDIQNNRPDLVMTALRPSDTKSISKLHEAYQYRLKRSDYKEEMFGSGWHTPKAVLLNKKELSMIDTTASNEVLLDAEFTDSESELLKAMVMVNGVPLNGINGFALNGRTMKLQIKVPLSVGENRVTLSCFNKNLAESARTELYISYKPAIKPKKTLYIIAIAVSVDKNDENNRNFAKLNFAVKDGRDFIQLFKSRKTNSAFQAIEIDSLFESNATKEKILQLRSKLLQSKPDDEIVVLFSGHGDVLPVNGKKEFYFMNYDFDRSDPNYKQGLSFGDIDHLFDGLLAKKRIVFLDACHSGEIDPDQNTLPVTNSDASSANPVTASSDTSRILPKRINNPDKVVNEAKIEYMKLIFNDLSINSGTTILSAAQYTLSAFQIGSLQNGVFTYAIIEGLKKREADTNPKDQSITVNELKTYLPKKVESLSRSFKLDTEQKATTRQESLYNDWIVW